MPGQKQCDDMLEEEDVFSETTSLMGDGIGKESSNEEVEHSFANPSFKEEEDSGKP